MNVTVTIYMKDGRKATTTTTRKALHDFWQRQSDNIYFARIDCNMKIWIFDNTFGWFKGIKFRYVPNRPDLWHQKPKLEATKQTPFDYI